MVEPASAATGFQARAVRCDASKLLMLLTFLSPAFPVGSYAYSHGLEEIIDRGGLRAPGPVRFWIADLLSIGSGWNDAVLLCEASRAAASGDRARLEEAARLAESLAAGKERHLETMALGRAFLNAAGTGWPCEPLGWLRETGGASYPVAVGAVAAGQGIAIDETVLAYLNAFAANLVSVAVRLAPLGQSAGLRILAELHPVIIEVAARAVASGLDDLGSATLLAEIASMRHETQYSRVFRT